MPVAEPLVSVLLPARDAAVTLAESLASLQDQTFRDWECLVLDDGSTDRTRGVAEGFAASDPRFRVFSAPEPRGIIETLNEGAARARGHYLARQDADDRSLPRRLELSLDLLTANPHVDVAACRIELFPQERIRPGWRAYAEWLNRLVTPEAIAGDIYVESPLPHPTVLMPRELLASCGGYREHGWPEDYDLWLRLHVAGRHFAKPEPVLYQWRHHEGRLTHRDERYAPEAFLACKLHHLAARLGDSTLLVWGAGRDGSRLARALEQRRLRVEAFIDIDPRKIGRTRGTCPVISPEQLGHRAHCPACAAPPLILVAVGTKGARQLIREHLYATGWSEPEDFLCLH